MSREQDCCAALAFFSIQVICHVCILVTTFILISRQEGVIRLPFNSGREFERGKTGDRDFRWRGAWTGWLAAWHRPSVHVISSHVSNLVPGMNNRICVALCQASKLFIFVCRRASASSAGHSPLWGPHNTTHIHLLRHTQKTGSEIVCGHIRLHPGSESIFHHVEQTTLVLYCLWIINYCS